VSAEALPPLVRRYDGERWEDLLQDGDAPQVDAALWEAASYGVDGETLAAAIRQTLWRGEIL